VHRADPGEAEDLAGEIELDLDPLPVVADMLEARKPGAPLVHEHWGDNLFSPPPSTWNFEAVKAKAAVSVTRELRTSRQVMSPLEGRGVVRAMASRSGSWSCTPRPSSRTSCARAGRMLGVDEARIRVVAPDVGGGFGYKGILLPRRWRWPGPRARSARRSVAGGPARGLTANANCREHHYILTAYADARAACWRSTARRPSIPVPTRPIPSPPAWRRGR
jgi:carbon-monoxide dehydrogenase large subunit